MIKIGMLIGERYEIAEKIGTGGMSDVYRAKCHKLNRFVAVKVLKQEFSENTDFVSKFRVEAQAAAGLMHPSIVNVYDVGEENGIYYIVMELVEGITLKKYIEKKARLSVKEAISIAIQVSMGIECAHNNHIIHRDIKPQNIIISKEGKVKVTDFGIAKAATSNTVTSNVMGSVHYTSPEQARGGYSDEKSDIYSMGVTLFEMLTGRVPFNGETTVAIAIKHIQEEMPSPREYIPEIPISVEQIVFKCTQKSPDRRYQTMPELVEDLKRSLMNPDDDFVKVVDFESKEETRMISERDLVKIKSQADSRDYTEREVRKKSQPPSGNKGKTKKKKRPPVYEEEFSMEPEEVDSFDPKMERITTVLTIVTAIIIGCILLFIAGRAVGVFQDIPFLSGISSNKKELVMIDVIGLDLEEARIKLKKEGIDFETQFEASTSAENVILSSTVKSGDKIDKNKKVVLTVSSGQNGISVPDVTGMNEAEATAKLGQENFKVEKKEEFTQSTEKGIVVSQTPQGGTKAARETTITLVISLGKEENKVRVPDVLGMTEAAARATLEGAGLACGTVTPVENAEYQPNTVCYQSYSVGSFIESKTPIDLRVSAGGNYRCDVSVQAPLDYTTGNATVTLVGDNTIPLWSQTTTTFPVNISLGGIQDSVGGKVVIMYTISAEEQVTDENGNVTTQIKQIEQVEELPVVFTKE